MKARRGRRGPGAPPQWRGWSVIATVGMAATLDAQAIWATFFLVDMAHAGFFPPCKKPPRREDGAPQDVGIDTLQMRCWLTPARRGNREKRPKLVLYAFEKLGYRKSAPRGWLSLHGAAIVDRVTQCRYCSHRGVFY